MVPRWEVCRLLLLRHRESAEGLYVIDACGGNQRMLASLTSPTGLWSWSPDSTTIVCSDAGSAFLVTLAGESRKVADNFQWPAFFPDGRQLVGSTTTPEADHPVLAVLDLTNGMITPATDPRPVPADGGFVSPDGRYMGSDRPEKKLRSSPWGRSSQQSLAWTRKSRSGIAQPCHNQTLRSSSVNLPLGTPAFQ